MGLQSPHQILWKTVKIPIDLALLVIQNVMSSERARKIEENAASDPSTPEQAQRPRPKIGMDANLVAYKHLGGRTGFSPVESVMHIAETLSEKHYNVVIGADHPTNRHPSKRATCKQRADDQKNGIRLAISRADLQLVLSEKDIESEAQHAKDVKDAQSRIEKLERQVARRFPPEFAANMTKEVNEYNPEGKGEVSSFIAPTQADPCLAKMVVDGDLDAIISDDSDFSMYIGANGADIMIKEVMISSKKGAPPITSCRLCTGQEHIATIIESVLVDRLGFSPFEKDDKDAPKRDGGKRDGNTPNYPIFSGVKDIWSELCLLLLLAVMLALVAFQTKARRPWLVFCKSTTANLGLSCTIHLRRRFPI